MKSIKKYLALAPALLCVVLGAAMPELTAQMQDAQVGKLQKRMELNLAELTLNQEDVSRTLQLLSQQYIESIWTGETRLSEESACQKTLSAIESLESCGLLPNGETERLSQSEGSGEPYLLVAEDGSSALVWDCTWGYDSETLFSVDDATGEVVRISLFKPLTDLSGTYDDDYPYQLDRWLMFLQDHYDLELEEVWEDEGGNAPALLYRLCFTAGDGAELTFSLQLMGDYFLLNF